MSAFVRRYPALSLLILAGILGVAPLVVVTMGMLPQGFVQLGAASASVAGIILAAIEGRKRGVRELLGRILIWRVGIQWWAFALLFPVIPSVVALYVYHALGGPPVDWSNLKPLPSIIPLIVILTVVAGLGEEFGWRGFALPRLQARHNALNSALRVGVIWAIWHVALFYTPGTVQSEMRMQAGPLISIGGYAVWVIMDSIWHTWVFNNTKGSVLLAAVMHGAANAWTAYIDVYRGHVEGVLVFAGLSVIISLVIVLLAGATNLSTTIERNVVAVDGS